MTHDGVPNEAARCDKSEAQTAANEAAKARGFSRQSSRASSLARSKRQLVEEIKFEMGDQRSS